MPPKSIKPTKSRRCPGELGEGCSAKPTKVVTWLDGRTFYFCARHYRAGLAFFRSRYEDAKARYDVYKGATNTQK